MTGKALCSIGSGPHAALLEVSRPTFEEYAARHGYSLITPDEIDTSRPAPWAKVPLLREVLAEFETVVWIDADAVIVDSSLDIADALGSDRAFGLVRHRREEQRVPNTGVLVMRSEPVVQELLETVWNTTGAIDHPWWENAALAQVLGYTLPGSLEPGVRGLLYRLGQRLAGRELRPAHQVRTSRFEPAIQFLSNEWNSIYHDSAEHPRIVHCLGTSVAQRLSDMKTVLEVQRPA